MFDVSRLPFDVSLLHLFTTMINNNARREFIRNVSLAGTSVLLSPGLSKASAFFKGSPNDKVVLGIMGTNSRGMFLASTFAKLPNVEIAYICDPDANVLAKTITAIEKQTGKKPEGIADIRKLLERKDFDALAIAAPDHWHAPAAIMGLQAGKNIYVEKPCSHNPHEGEMLVQAAEKYKLKVQMGSQRQRLKTCRTWWQNCIAVQSAVCILREDGIPITANQLAREPLLLHLPISILICGRDLLHVKTTGAI